MSKDKKIFIGIIFVTLVCTLIVIIMAITDKKEEVNNISNSDAIIFKNEYESLNNVKNGEDVLQELSISEFNPVDIISEEEMINLLSDGTGIIYLGYADSLWSRSILPVLLSALDNMGIDKLYYLNIKNIRDEKQIVNNEIEIKTEGSNNYYKMLELLNDHLNPYYLVNSNNKQVDTKEKRIYAPTVIGVKEGKVASIYNDIVDEDKYNPLNEELKEEVYNKFLDIINKVYDEICDEAC